MTCDRFVNTGHLVLRNVYRKNILHKGSRVFQVKNRKTKQRTRDGVMSKQKRERL
jgi:hypothetical protein